jgi:CRP-like cAMP-binding protein
VRAGKTIGEMSILDGMPHSATAVVVEPATLLLLTRNKFEEFMQGEPEVALKVLRKMAMLMSLRLRQTSGVLLDHLPK